MSAAIERLVDRLMDAGNDREAEAVDLVKRLYGHMSMADLVALVQVALEPQSPMARLKHLDDLMAEFDAVAKVMHEPPAGLAQLIRDAVTGSVQGTAQMFAAQQVVIDALRVPATLQLKWMDTLEQRMLEFWGNEPPRFRSAVNAALRLGLERGQGIDQIATNIKAQTNASYKRSVRIARQEVGNAAAFAMKEGQAQAGCTHYIWRTASDSRVRDSHKARNGQVFSWDDPPAGGHPGEDFLCRCVALAMPPGVKVVDSG